MTAPLLELNDVSRVLVSGGLLGRQRTRAVDDVSFSVAPTEPEIFTIIGESGSGKTTLARMILGIVPPTSGEIRFRGDSLQAVWSRRRLDFMRQVQPIFQNPFEAFNPLRRIDRYLFAAARRFGSGDPEQNAERALRQVGLSLAEIARRFPHELSGGQLQRTAIARALISTPSLIVADEPVSMVDASLRMSIVNLFATLRDRLDVSIIYITHDLATAYAISDRIIIMRSGRIVEAGAARAVLDDPRHPYSRQLKDAVLSIEPAIHVTREGQGTGLAG
jgi:ABC-type glutathione transport system ATPase component